MLPSKVGFECWWNDHEPRLRRTVARTNPWGQRAPTSATALGGRGMRNAGINADSKRAPLLAREGELARRIALAQRFHLAVLEHKFVNGVARLWRAELEALHLSQLPRGPAGKDERKPGAGLIDHLKFHL